MKTQTNRIYKNATKILLVSLLGLIPLITIAQKSICGFDIIQQKLLRNPNYASKLKETNKLIQKKVEEIELGRRLNKNLNMLPGPLYEIPVVVHVIYKSGDATPGTSTNPSDAQIQNAIDRLNANFAAASGSGNQGASSPLRFALAKRRPDCGATTGIERINGSSLSEYNTYGVSIDGVVPGTSDDAIKALSTWPEKQYYNIWVVWKINASTDGSSIVTGYASLPIDNKGNWHDFTKEGIFIIGSHINSTSTTLTHEMGHAMGLYHTFENGSYTNCPPAENASTCSSLGDLVCDTDPVKNLLFAGTIVDNDINPCTGSAYNGSQRNIMGYGAERNIFTSGQSTRMQAALNAVRMALATSLGSTPPPPTLVKSSTAPPNITNPNNTGNIGPCNITFNNLVYNSNGYNNDGFKHYIDNSCNIGTDLNSHQSYSLIVTTESNRQKCKAWIDLNNNGIFETPGEIVMNTIASSGDFTHQSTISGTLLNSSSAKNTLLRMRVMADYYLNTDFGPTSQLEYGQTEDFWVKIVQGLPVVFNNISATLKNTLLNVNWETASEHDNSHFIIEVSTDGQSFKTLGTVNSNALNGNSDIPIMYNYNKDISNNSVLLGSMLLLSFLLAFGWHNRNRKYSTLVILPIFIVIASSISCNKNDNAFIEHNSKKVFVRIAQIDKQGSTSYSKIVAVAQE